MLMKFISQEQVQTITSFGSNYKGLLDFLTKILENITDVQYKTIDHESIIYLQTVLEPLLAVEFERTTMLLGILFDASNQIFENLSVFFHSSDDRIDIDYKKKVLNQLIDAQSKNSLSLAFFIIKDSIYSIWANEDEDYLNFILKIFTQQLSTKYAVLKQLVMNLLSTNLEYWIKDDFSDELKSIIQQIGYSHSLRDAMMALDENIQDSDNYQIALKACSPLMAEHNSSSTKKKVQFSRCTQVQYFYKNLPPNQKIYTAKNYQFTFQEIPVPGDGLCGFYAINESKEMVLSTLKSLAKNPDVRKSFTEEIYGHFLLLYTENKRKGEECNKDRIFQLIDQLFAAEEKKNMPHGEKNDLSNEEMVLNFIKNSIKHLCATEELYENYLEHINIHNWISIQGLITFAATKGINVCIWQKQSSSSELALIAHNGEATAENTRHIFFKNDHYDKLVRNDWLVTEGNGQTFDGPSHKKIKFNS